MLSKRKAASIAKNQLQYRNQLWPDCDQDLWERKANKGFTTIPKTMPLILQIMDDLSNRRPVSSTYLGLWCETWDNSMANLSKKEDLAMAAGFSGQRSVYTWRARMLILKELKFIDIKPGKSGEFTTALIYNPHLVIKWHHEQKTPGLQERKYNALLEKALEIGAKDMSSKQILQSTLTENDEASSIKL